MMLSTLLAARPVASGEYAVGRLRAPVPATLSAQVDAILRSRYEEPLTLAKLAKAAGVSRSTLTHRYRAETGMTPFARLHGWRLEAARGLLLKGLRMKEIALRTGFYDEYHLSKAFKRRYGVCPRLYARPAPDASSGPGVPGRLS